jgi:hypothetical protein
MLAKTAWTLAVCLCGAVIVGCSTAPSAIRAQSPPEQAAPVMAASAATAYTPGCPDGNCGPGGYCPDGNCGPYGDCYSDGCHDPHCMGCNLHPYKEWRPTHYHSYTYSIPWGMHSISPSQLSYPPANQPAAVVVYPYYTVRGPTDFFYQ